MGGWEGVVRWALRVRVRGGGEVGGGGEVAEEGEGGRGGEGEGGRGW